MTIDPQKNNCMGSADIKERGVRNLDLTGQVKRSPLSKHTPAETDRRTSVVRRRSFQPVAGSKNALIPAQYKDTIPTKNESALERSSSIRQHGPRLTGVATKSRSDIRQRVSHLDLIPGEAFCAGRDMLVECFGFRAFPASAF